MRIAVISSPRSGNSWLRLLLAETLVIAEFAVHNWREMMENLPQDFVLQVHWYREPEFQKFLRDNGFKVVTITRHPLDVLLSVLRFCKHDHGNVRWLEGNCDLERLFDKDVTPASRVFLEWCAGFGCENLLSVTYQWFHDPDAIAVRYEDLVLDPRRVAGSLLSRLTGNNVSVSDKTLEKYDLPYWKSQPNKHGWQGKAGLWKELYSWRACRAIYKRHQRVFNTLGYGIMGARLTNSTRSISRRWEELNPDDAAPARAATG